MKKVDGSWIFCMFLGNNRHHMPVYAKMINTWVGTVLTIAKVHMSSGTLQGAVTSVVLVDGVSLASILQAGDWARDSTSARHFLNIYHYHRLAPGFSSTCCLGPY